jgi:hypothetical protein
MTKKLTGFQNLLGLKAPFNLSSIKKLKQFVWIHIVWAFLFLKKERGGLFTSIFPSANWRKGRIYVAIPSML